jgi:hypothetical protein
MEDPMANRSAIDRLRQWLAPRLDAAESARQHHAGAARLVASAEDDLVRLKGDVCEFMADGSATAPGKSRD